jgi:hypothetical protein
MRSVVRLSCVPGCLFLALGLLLLGPCPVSGQEVARLNADLYQVTYRPPGAEYRTVQGKHFNLIYQKGTEDATRRIRRALRRSRAGTDSLVGLTPRPIDMPIVVDGFSDRSNGFVTPFPFKQEIEAPSIREDPLVARSSSWPALVGPHELVHAMHAEIDAGFGYGSVLRVFAPDAARASNLTAPRGLVEGIAVYRESRFEKGVGRLNAPLFTMKMRAAMLSDDPWSLTQMLEPPRYTQPFNRFYIGGAHAFQTWAERGDTTSTAFFREAAALHNRFPFLGFGVGLWTGLGEWPGGIDETLRTTLRTRYKRDLDRRSPFTDTETIAGRDGRNYRRPYWLDENTVVAYLHGYDVRRGFYRINVETGERSLIRVQSITEDYTYSLGRDTSALYASRYVPDPWVPTQDVAEVERVDLETGTATQLTEEGRAFAPVEAPSGAIWAVQNDGSFSQWATLKETRLRPLTHFERTRFKQIAPSPDGHRVAVLLNVDGTQRLYRIDHRRREAVRLRPWLGLKDAIIYDVSWGPEGRYLLFSADLGGVANVYAFDTRTNDVLRLTNVPFGALEPALSPDRTSVAFVEYQHERHELVRIPFRPNAAPTVDPSRVILGAESPRPPTREIASAPTDTIGFEDSRPYESWRHLSPRMVYPVLNYDLDEADRPEGGRFEELGVGVGVGVAGNDPLGRWQYRGTAFWQDGRLWGSATVRSGRWLLRPSLTVFNTPETIPATVRTDQGPRPARVGFEERGVSVGTRLPIRLRSNVYQSVAAFALGAEYRQTRFFGDTIEAIQQRGASGRTRWRDRVTLSPQAVLGYRVQQNPRDLVPNQGLILRSSAEVDAWTDGVAASRALLSEADLYLPLALRSHTGVRIGVGVLTQNAGSVVGTDAFVPRGYEDLSLGAGSFLRLGAEVTQPLWYVDDGSTLVPIYVKALYGYGFGQTLTPVGEAGSFRSSVGGGIGVQFRLFYLLDIDLQFGAAYRLEPGDADLVWR